MMKMYPMISILILLCDYKRGQETGCGEDDSTDERQVGDGFIRNKKSDYDRGKRIFSKVNGDRYGCFSLFFIEHGLIVA